MLDPHSAHLDLVEEILGDLPAVVGVYETEGVEATTLGVAGAGGRGVLGEVGLHQGDRLLLVAAMDHSRSSRG
jgi:hypothetical protein